LAQIQILLTGGTGQIGSEILRHARPEWRIVAPSRNEFDLANGRNMAAFMEARPWSAVINAAAYTAVDRAENDTEEAWRVNAHGPAILAEASARWKIPLIHLSTDYVFDGRKSGFYSEQDPVAPLGVYGASKEGGEKAVRTGNPSHVILRTAWVVSSHGTNFIKTMLRLGAERKVLSIVDDQRGCPTNASDIAEALILIAKQLIEDRNTPTGTYHFVNAGEASWCEFARTIFSIAAARGRPVPAIVPIRTHEYPTAAQRPANSRLSTAKLQRDFGIVPRPWQPAIAEIIDALLEGRDQR
jgi:dTDP-4-dehydrorhamnose reductase